jgi:hypothetical protein
MLVLAAAQKPLTNLSSLDPLDHRDIDRYVKTHLNGRGITSKTHANSAHFALARKLAMHQIRKLKQPTFEQVAKNRQQIAEASRRGGDLRGNTQDRADSRENIFNRFHGQEHGSVPCVNCGLKLHHSDDSEINPNGYEKMERDKILTGHEGGRYTLNNLLPSCKACNHARGDGPNAIESLPWEKL